MKQGVKSGLLKLRETITNYFVRTPMDGSAGDRYRAKTGGQDRQTQT